MSVKEIIESILDYIVRGGPGSGNFGHEGVQGQVGENKGRSISITDELMQYVGEQLTLNYPSETDPETGIELSKAQLLDLYMDENEIFAIVTLQDGKLYKMPIKVDADNKITSEPLVQVAMEFSETSRTLSITREKSGKVRWFAFPACTAVLNRSGEIDSTSLFDSFVEHANKTGNYPELDFYHMGEKVVLGKADWIAREGVAYCASGYFYDTPEAQAAIRAISEEPEFWGLSIAYLPTAQPTTLRTIEGIAIPVYTRGINRFISLLPEKSAASIMTSITKEVTRMNSDMKLAIRKLAGDDEELAKSLEEKIDGINRQSADMVSREIPQTVTEVTHTEKSSTPVQTPELRANELDPETMKTVVAAVLTAPELEARIKEIIAASKGEEAGAEPAAVPTEAPEMKTESKTEEVIGQAVATMDRMTKELESIQTRLTAFETDKAQKQREIENDTPAKRAMYRPRAAITPQTMQERSKNRSNMDLSAIATETLSKLESN